MGGRPNDQPLNLEEHALADWEVLADALNRAAETLSNSQ